MWEDKLWWEEGMQWEVADKTLLVAGGWETLTQDMKAETPWDQVCHERTVQRSEPSHGLQ